MDNDGKLSLREAIEQAKTVMKEAGLKQDPEVVGPDADLKIVSFNKVPPQERSTGDYLAY